MALFTAIALGTAIGPLRDAAGQAAAGGAVNGAPPIAAEPSIGADEHDEPPVLDDYIDQTGQYAPPEQRQAARGEPVLDEADPELGEGGPEDQGGQPVDQQGAQPGGQQGDQQEDFLEGFDLGEGRYEDLSFNQIREAVQMRDRYHNEVLAQRGTANLHEQLQTLFGEATPHYSEAQQLYENLSGYLTQIRNSVAEPPLKLLEQGEEGAKKYAEQMNAYKQQQDRAAQVQAQMDKMQALQQERNKQLQAHRDHNMAQVINAVWPEAVAKETAQGIESFLRRHGYTGKDLWSSGDVKLVRVMARLHKLEGAVQRSRGAAKRQPPRIVRRAAAGGTRQQTGQRGRQVTEQELQRVASTIGGGPALENLGSYIDQNL